MTRRWGVFLQPTAGVEGEGRLPGGQGGEGAPGMQTSGLGLQAFCRR